MNVQLREESTAKAVATETRGLWRATLLTPGQGSSGNWLDETIRRDGPVALRKGAKCFVTHNRRENGEPDPFSMWGTLASDSWYEEGHGLQADIQVLPSWIDKVAEVAPHTALSVFLMGDSDADGNITKILEDVQNGVDMVVYPGRPGSSLVEKLYESALAASNKTPSASVVEDHETKGLVTMAMEKDVQEAFDKLDAKIDAIAKGAVAEAQAEVDEAAVAAKVDELVEEKVEAVKVAVAAVQAVEADVLPSSYKSLMESAYKGDDVTADIASAKEIKAEAVSIVAEAATVESGRLGEAATEGYVLRSVRPKKEAK